MPNRVVALLRGINVGGAKKVEMARLRALIESLGHENVRTLLNSGNAVFTCHGPAGQVAGALEDAIEAEFGFTSRVVVRTGTELAKAMNTDPLLDEPSLSVLDNGSRHFVGFMAEKPRAAAVKELTARDFGDDLLRIVGPHLYLWCPQGLSASAFFKLDFDRELGVAVTSRNWNTVTKLAELVQASD
jgi:uncharacterized protein (DUF1697 family)